MSIITSIINFSNDLSNLGFNFEELTIEMPYNMRIKLQLEMMNYLSPYNSDRMRGHVSGFIINTQQCSVKINSLQSEREEVLKLELTKIEERVKEIKKQLGS